MKIGKYKKALKHFEKARNSNKLSLDGMEYYSTCLWHLNNT